MPRGIFPAFPAFLACVTAAFGLPGSPALNNSTFVYLFSTREGHPEGRAGSDPNNQKHLWASGRVVDIGEQLAYREASAQTGDSKKGKTNMASKKLKKSKKMEATKPLTGFKNPIK
jgi:hypothetical protein